MIRVGVLFLPYLCCCPSFGSRRHIPVLSTITKQANNTAWLYSLNTFGAVIGVLGSAFVLLPTIGVRNTELFGMILCIAVCFASLMYRYQDSSTTEQTIASVPMKTLLLMGVVGFASMSLEIVWSRLGALLIGGSVYAFAVVLAVFLTGISVGSAVGRRLDRSHLPIATIAMGVLTILGCYSWRWLPHGLAMGWDWFGNDSMLFVGTCLIGCAMAGAPIASGAIFSLCLKQGTGAMNNISGRVLTANTIGGVIGVLLTGPLLMPTIGIVNTSALLSATCVLTACLLYWQTKRTLISLTALSVLFIGMPRWDVAVYATGLYNRMHGCGFVSQSH